MFHVDYVLYFLIKCFFACINLSDAAYGGSSMCLLCKMIKAFRFIDGCLEYTISYLKY